MKGEREGDRGREIKRERNREVETYREKQRNKKTFPKKMKFLRCDDRYTKREIKPEADTYTSINRPTLQPGADPLLPLPHPPPGLPVWDPSLCGGGDGAGTARHADGLSPG